MEPTKLPKTIVIPVKVYQSLVMQLIDELWDELTYHRLYEEVKYDRSIWEIQATQSLLRSALELEVDARRDALLQWPWGDQWRVADWLLSMFVDVRSQRWLRVDHRRSRWVEYVPSGAKRANAEHERMLRALQDEEGIRLWVERGGDQDFARRVGCVIVAGLWP